MRIRMKARFFFPAVLLLTIFLIAPASPPEQSVLLKITPPSGSAQRAIADAGGVVVQELRSCLLVNAPSKAVPRLNLDGLVSTSISFPAQAELYFLVYSKLPSPLPAQPADIRCLLLEEGIWLLWTDNPDFRNWLVQPYQLKALSLSGVFPGRDKARAAWLVADDAAAQSRSRSWSIIPGLVAQVSIEKLRADILTLQNFKTRFASTPQCEAAGDFILQRFQQLGLPAVTDPFKFEGYYTSRNIVAVIPGKVFPKRMVLACAHYDSTSGNPLLAAPGADDNASGTAAILELARILAAEKFDFSIVLLCVSAEEWGLYGSDHYARQARKEGAEIIAVVNLDMIGYPGSQQRVLDVIGNKKSEWLADRFIAIAQPYVGLRLAKVINSSLTWSDHSSFWDQGYAALCGNEDSDNPYYHTASDTLDTLDLGFATEAVRASLAAVVDLAEPVNPSAAATPVGLRAQSQISVSLFSSMKTVYLHWQANPDPVAGYLVFRADRSHGLYQCLTAQPIGATSFKDSFLAPEQAYFYVLTAVDEQGRQSDYSREVRDDENN